VKLISVMKKKLVFSMRTVGGRVVVTGWINIGDNDGEWNLNAEDLDYDEVWNMSVVD
jgi:hypothetical protein